MIHTLVRILAEAPAKIDSGSIGLNNPARDANGALTSILNVVYMVAGIVAVIVIVVAGYLYVTSSGDAAQTKRAKNAILGAVAGIVVIISAFTITQFVLGRL